MNYLLTPKSRRQLFVSLLNMGGQNLCLRGEHFFWEGAHFPPQKRFSPHTNNVFSPIMGGNIIFGGGGKTFPPYPQKLSGASGSRWLSVDLGLVVVVYM
jgi:hypothetical protein